MRKIVLTILTLFWLFIIFQFSAAPADESSQMSLSVGHAIGHIFIPQYDEWDLKRQDDFAKEVEYPIRKCAHASEYAVLGILLTATLAAWNMKSKNNIFISLIAGVIYASSDEFHQLFVPGRDGRVTDVMIDSLGLLAGILAVHLAAHLISSLRQKNHLRSRTSL